MEKQILFLFDYNMSITEEDVATYAQPFIEQYSFDSPPLSPAVVSQSLSTQTLPVTTCVPFGPVILPGSPNNSKAICVPIPPELDRRVSNSSLGSDGPFTPPSSDLDDRDKEIFVPDQALHHTHNTVFAGSRREHVRLELAAPRILHDSKGSFSRGCRVTPPLSLSPPPRRCSSHLKPSARRSH